MAKTRAEMAEWCEAEAAATRHFGGSDIMANKCADVLDALALEYRGLGKCPVTPDPFGACDECHGTGFTPAGLEAARRVRGAE